MTKSFQALQNCDFSEVKTYPRNEEDDVGLATDMVAEF